MNLTWSLKDYEKFALEPLALSIMVNDNWFMKGNSSQKISLHAYSQLQSKYLSYTASLENQSQDTWGNTRSKPKWFNISINFTFLY